MKGMIYKMVLRPAVMYVLEMVGLTKRKEADLEVKDLNMLRFSLGVNGQEY